MKCDLCGIRDATVHYTEIKNQDVHELHLCDRCAEEKGFTSSEQKGAFPAPNLLGGMVDEEFADVGVTSGGLVCDRCGLTYRQFKKSGRLGCSWCYDAFRVPLTPLLKRIHGNTHYAGKIPKLAEERHIRARELRNLKVSLEACVQSEEFEEAAGISDRIRAMEDGDE